MTSARRKKKRAFRADKWIYVNPGPGEPTDGDPTDGDQRAFEVRLRQQLIKFLPRAIQDLIDIVAEEPTPLRVTSLDQSSLEGLVGGSSGRVTYDEQCESHRRSPMSCPHWGSRELISNSECRFCFAPPNGSALTCAAQRRPRCAQLQLRYDARRLNATIGAQLGCSGCSALLGGDERGANPKRRAKARIGRLLTPRAPT